MFVSQGPQLTAANLTKKQEPLRKNLLKPRPTPRVDRSVTGVSSVMAAVVLFLASDTNAWFVTTMTCAPFVKGKVCM